jgi:hypothetical protein
MDRRAFRAKRLWAGLHVFSLPLLVGWLLFHGPLATQAMHVGTSRTLLRRLPHAWVAANVGMAGISALAMPLVTMTLRSRVLEVC